MDKLITSRELAKQGSTPLSGFEVAVRGIKVKDTPLEALKETLRLVILKLGLRAQNIPQAEEKAVLIAHIQQYYGGHTPAEILLAFDMAINGQLEVEVNSYENFSCAYFSSIMIAYRVWAAEQARQIKPKEIIPAPVEITWEEKFYDIQELKQGPNRKMQLIAPYFYDWLTDFGILRHTPAEKKRLLGEAVEYREGELKAAAELDITGQRGDKTELIKFQSLMVNGFIKGSSELNRMITLSKQIGVYEWKQSLKTQQGSPGTK